ncbi:MAG TPA: class I SAM-dependent methyltransferase [Caulobacteraceae bacterium]|nr:class I SAM-dependent methyltransferase [Caulobacteraceae bacterium]
MSGDYDPATFAFYEREAAVYTSQPHDGQFPWLWRFLADLAPGAEILELGCGGGRDAEEMIRLGFKVTPTDGSPAMAAQAERRLGRPVRVMTFDALEAEAAFDAVWASASLLHARAGALLDIFARIRRALRAGGRFCAGFKRGEGEGYDRLGRYYNFPTEAALRDAYAAAGPWRSFEVEHEEGGGYDGVRRHWLVCLAVRS